MKPGALFPRSFFRGHPLLDAFGLGGFESLFNRRDGLLLATARTRRTFRLDLGGRAFFLKIQWMPRLRPRYFLRPSAYAREVRAFARMEVLGLRTPEVIALGERRRFGFLAASLLVTAGVPGAVDLESWAREGFLPRDGIPPVRELLAELDRTVAAIHERGRRFGDLKWRNILAAPPDGKGSHLVFIDQRRFRSCPTRRLGRGIGAADFRLLRKEAARWEKILPFGSS